MTGTVPGAPAETGAPRGRDLRALLHELLQLPHVRGGALVGADGLLIAAELPGELRVEALAALAATLGRELELRGPRLRRGTFVLADFGGERGHLLLAAAAVGFIVLITDPEVERERVRRALHGAVDAVRAAWKRGAGPAAS